VEKYKPRGEKLPSATWRIFLELHLKELVAIDFFIVPTATFKWTSSLLSSKGGMNIWDGQATCWMHRTSRA